MQTTSEDKDQKTEMSFADRVFFVVAMCLAVFIKPSQYLMERAYKLPAAGGVIRFFGILSAAAAAIASGYWFGLDAGRTWVATLTIGATSGAITYFYGVPLFYCFLYDWIVEAGKYFWKRVPEPGDKANSYGLSPWFSNFLMRSGYLMIAAGAIGLFLTIAIKTHTSMAPDSAIGGLFAWAVSGVLAFVVTFPAGSFAVKILSAQMPGLAIISGGLLLWASSAYVFGGFGFPWWLVVALDAVSFIVWVGALFPALHVFITKRFFWLAEWMKSVWTRWRDAVIRFYESVYITPSREFKGFFGQSVNIALSVAALYFVGSYLVAAGFGWGVIGLLSFIAMLAMYTVGGTIISALPNGAVIGGLSLIPSIWVAWQASGSASITASVLLGLFFEAGLVGLFMPIFYQFMSTVVKHTVGHEAGLTLVRVHEEMVENISTSWRTTFSDKSEYAEQFAHFANILVAVGGFMAVSAVMQLSGLAGTFGLFVTACATVALYLAGGKFLPSWGNRFLAGLSGFFVGLWCGIATYQATGGIIVAVLALAGGWLFVALVVYPLIYATTKSPFSAMGVSSRLFGACQSLHAFFFGFVERSWTGVVKAYRAIQFSFRPAWDRVSRMWDENWQRARNAVNKVFGG